MPGAIHQQPFGQLLDEIAARTPAPGGGAVAGAAGALAASLGEMVMAYSIGKRDLAQHEPALRNALHRLTRARGLFTRLGDEDAAAYGLVNELQKLPESDARRMKDLPGALRAGVQIPLSVLATAADVLALLDEVKNQTNRHLDSDLRIAAILAEAAARAAACNVDVNLSSMADAEFKGQSQRVQAEMLRRCAGHLASVVEHKRA